MKRAALGLLAAGTLAGGLASVAVTAGAAHAGAPARHVSRVTAMPPFCVGGSASRGGPYDGICVWVPGTV